MTRPHSDADPLTRDMADARFSRLYAEHWRELLEYSVRRTAGPEDAADVVEETFLVAWRRLAEVPDGREAVLWLYGVARNVLANQRRGERRRGRLGERLAAELAVRAHSAAPDPGRMHLLGALARLADDDREILLLAGWEELEPSEIARVLDISAVACRSRLARARRRLRRVLGDDVAPARQGTGEFSCGEAR